MYVTYNVLYTVTMSSLADDKKVFGSPPQILSSSFSSPESGTKWSPPFSCTDVTNTYVATNETLDDIDDMIQDPVGFILLPRKTIF